MTADEQVRAVLADPEWTRRVVVSAVLADALLSGPERTPDGDSAVMVARSGLRDALVDWASVRAALPEDDRDDEHRR